MVEDGPGRDRTIAGRREAGNWLDQIPGPAAILSSTGHVEQFNDQAAALFGWNEREPAHLTNPDAAWLRRLVRESVTGEDVVTVISRRGEQGRTAVEVRCRRIDVDRMLALFRDCTSQVLAKTSRRSGEHHLRRLLGRLPEPVVVEQNGRIAYHNPAAARLVGVSPGELQGVPTTRLLPEATLQAVRSAASAAGGETEPVEVSLELGGRHCDLQVIAVPERYHRGDALVLLLRDISSQKKAEHGLEESAERLRRSEEQLRQAQKMDAIGRFAAGIAHDFNNLITAMQGHLQFVLEDLPEDSVVREDVLEVRRVADRATDLTRQLLTFARRQPYRPQPIPINEVVRDADRLLHRLMPEGIELKLVLDDSIPSALAERSQLERVLVNLAVNARDAMNGGGTITLRTSSIHLDGSYAAPELGLSSGHFVQLTISDTGCGMSADTQARMFEPFFTTKSEGTGLGLPTVYGIVKQVGGHISVYSEEGLGTTIKLFLRAATTVNGTIEAVTATADAAAGSEPVVTGAASVLLVEDDASIRQLAERTLRANGLFVMSAPTGEDALHIIESGHTFDVVVTDLMMPNMTGDELAAQIKQRQPNASVVIMSGFSADVLGGDSSAQHRHFLEKPFTQQQLLLAVRDALRD